MYILFASPKYFFDLPTGNIDRKWLGIQFFPHVFNCAETLRNALLAVHEQWAEEHGHPLSKMVLPDNDDGWEPYPSLDKMVASLWDREAGVFRYGLTWNSNAGENSGDFVPKPAYYNDHLDSAQTRLGALTIEVHEFTPRPEGNTFILAHKRERIMRGGWTIEWRNYCVDVAADLEAARPDGLLKLMGVPGHAAFSWDIEAARALPEKSTEGFQPVTEKQTFFQKFIYKP